MIADTTGNSIRVVAEQSGTFYGQKMTEGDIYAVAGNGTRGYSGDGGPATKAELDQPSGVTADGAGNLIVADTVNRRVRVVAASTGVFYGQKMTAGDLYTVAGTGRYGYSGDGGPALKARLARPDAVTVDQAGNLVVADSLAMRVRVVAAGTGVFYGQKMTAGDIYAVAGNGQLDYSGDGGPASKAEFDGMGALAVDHGGDMLTVDGTNRVRMVAASNGTFYGVPMKAGDVYTVAGDGESGFSGNGVPALKSKLNPSGGLALDQAGNLVLPSGNRVLVVAARTGTFYGRHMGVGRVYSVAGNGKAGYSGDGGPATSAMLSGPDRVAVDHHGNLVFDSGVERIRVVAVRTGTFYGQKMTAGDIYTVAGNGKVGFSRNGGPARYAEFNIATMGAVDAAGNLVINDMFNYRIRVVAVRTGTFYGQKMTAGDIYTVAGNGGRTDTGDGVPALEAGIFAANVTVDRWGNLLDADADNDVRVVAARTGTFYGVPMTAGYIYAVAGDGLYGVPVNGQPATLAKIDDSSVTSNQAGDLLIAGGSNGRVQKVSP